MKSEPSSDRSLLFDEAQEWLIRIRENPQSPQVRSAFEAWRILSPDHERQWSELCLLWHATGQAQKQCRPAGRARQKASWLPVASMPRIAAGFTMASAAFVALWLATPALIVRMTADHTTAVAKVKDIALDDGSRVQLAPGSALRIAFDDDVREVVLMQGEAFFDVAKDPKRKFRVIAAGAEVEVLGTAFDVEIGDDSTIVEVARGSVATRGTKQPASKSETVLAPGDAVSIDHRSGATTRSVVSADDVGAWRQGRLVVTNASVASVVSMIQRYDSAWITLADPTLGAKTVSGIYDLNTPELALGALVDPFGGTVRSIGATLRIISRY